jgi:primosomal replication protein N
MNRLLLQATLVERGALRYTPAGLPALDCSLKHESQATEAGSTRRASLEIKAIAIGEISRTLQAMTLGQEAGFAGFLTAQRNGRGIVFHLTAIDTAASDPD